METLVARTCAECGTGFETRPIYVERGQALFCSRSCARRNYWNAVQRERSPATRFWEKVAIAGVDECWPWIASVDRKGYGKFWTGTQYIAASRYAWILTNGDPGSLHVCHRCDNPPCCNPKHLYAGTRKDNAHDAVVRGQYVSPSRTKTHCPKGHPYTSVNHRKTKRICRICRTAQARAYRERQR